MAGFSCQDFMRLHSSILESDAVHAVAIKVFDNIAFCLARWRQALNWLAKSTVVSGGGGGECGHGRACFQCI